MFTPSRLALARRRRGLPQVELARRAGLSSRRISDYEHGRREPDDASLDALASAVRFPPGFLAKSAADEIPVDAVSFRARRKTSGNKLDTAVSAATVASEFNDWLEDRFELPSPAVPSLEGIDPETAADMVRTQWGVASESTNMVHLLESRGARVFALALDHVEVDGFSLWHGIRPFVFLNTLTSGERGRFDAAHELGHLVLHTGSAALSTQQSEQEANAFASAFLMPRTSVVARMPREPLPGQIVETKAVWGVSAMALAHRLHDLGLLSDEHYRAACVEFCRHGYRSSEPNGIPREGSQLLGKVLHSLRSRGINAIDIAEELAVPADDLAGLMLGLTITAVSGDASCSPADRSVTTPPQLNLVGPA